MLFFLSDHGTLGVVLNLVIRVKSLILNLILEHELLWVNFKRLNAILVRVLLDEVL